MSANGSSGPIASLSREDVLQLFLRDAESAAQQIADISALRTRFESLRAELLGVYDELARAYDAAMSHELVRGKIVELGLGDPAELSVVLPARPGRRRAPSRRPRAGKAAGRRGKPTPPSNGSVSASAESVSPSAGSASSRPVAAGERIGEGAVTP